MSGPITTKDPKQAVLEWFEKLSRYCSTVDYDSAEEIVDDGIASFGTHADAVRGLERLRREQWEKVWPRTTSFEALMDTVEGGGNSDLAWGMATWTSIGYDESGKDFERPGRATIVLRRSGGAWKAVHTHFSLFRGVRQDSHGRSAASSATEDG